ncbi:MAG: riboflavin synthase [Opitutaceae bacterium]|nr:riboflavin synthase [Verrucomicrobiales bacterium]
MFTGLVEETGSIERIEKNPKSIKLTVRTRVCGSDLKTGDSLAVNGCCLTVVKILRAGRDKLVQLDLLKETWQRTNLQFAKVGGLVNLERALRADARLGGHFVTGHIDGIGTITRWEMVGADHLLEIAAPAAVTRYVIFKGSIAVDGISLTVAGVSKKGFRLWIIPHTLEVTALRERKLRDAVNLEADLVGKYVERFVVKRS